jgi:superkiller protein 3
MPGVLLSLGKAFSSLGQPEEAIDAYRNCLELAPDTAEAWFQLGQAYYELKRYEDAKECHLAALQRDPDCKPAYHSLAMVCDRLGLVESAEEYRSEFAVREQRDRMPAEGRRHQYDDLTALRQFLAATYVSAGKVYANYGNAAHAESHLQSAIQTYPEDTESWMTLVTFYEHQGEIAAASETLEDAWNDGPQESEHFLRIGGWYVKLGRLDAAERAFRRAADLAPKRSEGFVALAQVYAYEDRGLGRARTAAETAVELQPSAPNYFLLATICQRCDDVPGALAALQRALELDPDNQQYRTLRLAILARMQNEDNEGH